MVSCQKIFNSLNVVKKKELSLSVKSKHLDMFGDKVKARTQARLAQIPVIPGSDGPVNSLEEVKNLLKSMITRLLLKHPLGWRSWYAYCAY